MLVQEPTQEEEGSDVRSHSQAPITPLYGIEKGISLSNAFQVLQEPEKAQGDLHKSLVDINLEPQPQPHLSIEKFGTQINSGNSLAMDNNTQVIIGSAVPALEVYNDRQTEELNTSQLIVAQEDLGQSMKSIGKRTLQERHTSFFQQRQNSRAVTIKTINLESLGTSSTKVVGDPKAKIPYNLSKQFGVAEPHEPTAFRFHIILQREDQHVSPESPLGFSFPLCGFGGAENHDHVIHLIGRQIMFFSEFLGLKQVSQIVAKAWLSSAVSFIPEIDNDGTRHVVLSIINCGFSESGYLYIHDEQMSEANALAKGHYHWRFIRDRMIFNEVLPSESVDGRQIIELLLS